MTVCPCHLQKENTMAIDKETGGYHTMDECRCKVSGIKSLLEQIRRATRGKDAQNDYHIFALSDSAIQMCNELIVEGKQDG